MVGQESSPNESFENGNSREFLKIGRWVTFNPVSMDAQPATGPIFDPLSKEGKEGEEKEGSKEEEGSAVAASENNNVSGVRKKLLIPAEEALESARAAAELVIKDAMEALQRTKQRLMEVLLPHHAASQAPPSADDKVIKVNPQKCMRSLVFQNNTFPICRLLSDRSLADTCNSLF
jgi:hypothetical protein